MRAGEVRAIHSNGRPWHGRIITFRLCRFTSSTSSLFSTAEVTNNLDVGVFGWSMFWGARTLHSYRGQVVGYVCRRCISSTPQEENVLLRASALRYIREVVYNEWTRTATVDDPRRPCLSHAILWIGRLLYSFFLSQSHCLSIRLLCYVIVKMSNDGLDFFRYLIELKIPIFNSKIANLCLKNLHRDVKTKQCQLVIVSCVKSITVGGTALFEVLSTLFFCKSTKNYKKQQQQTCVFDYTSVKIMTVFIRSLVVLKWHFKFVWF